MVIRPEGTGWAGTEDLEWSKLIDGDQPASPEEAVEAVNASLGRGAGYRRPLHGELPDVSGIREELDLS